MQRLSGFRLNDRQKILQSVFLYNSYYYEIFIFLKISHTLKKERRNFAKTRTPNLNAKTIVEFFAIY